MSTLSGNLRLPARRPRIVPTAVPAITHTPNRDFRLLLTAVGVSAVGSRVTRTALPMAAILTLGATPLQLGWLSILGVLPGALVAWWAGAWSDRRSRRSVMIATDWIRALLIFSIPVAAMLHWLTLPQFYLVAALVCMATVMFEIADHAFLPVLIPTADLLTANSRRETIDAVAEIGGPPLGGLLVQLLSATVALALDAVSFVVSAVLIGSIRRHEPVGDRNQDATAGAPRASLVREAREGAAMVLRIPVLRALFASTMLMTMFGSFLAPLYTLFALETLKLAPGMLGLVIGMGGVGALIGAAVAPRLISRLGTAATTRVSLLAAALAQVFIPLAPVDPVFGPAFLMAHQLVGDGFVTIYLVTEVSLRQRSIPIDALGRAAALWKMAASLLAPAGMLTGALLAERYGIRNALWCVPGGLLIACLPVLTHGAPPHRSSSMPA